MKVLFTVFVLLIALTMATPMFAQCPPDTDCGAKPGPSPDPCYCPDPVKPWDGGIGYLTEGMAFSPAENVEDPNPNEIPLDRATKPRVFEDPRNIRSTKFSNKGLRRGSVDLP
jgi:hypothetical protein